MHFAVRAVMQPFPKFTCMRWLTASCYPTRIKANLARKGHPLRLQIDLRNLRHAVAGFGLSAAALAKAGDPGCGLAPNLPSLLKIARATSWSVSTDVSTRTSATLA